MGNSGSQRYVHANRVFLFAICAGMAIRALLILWEPNESFARYGSDDQFYYTQIAGHLANGEGFTFDGSHSTTGFQPLFLALLSPFGKWLLYDWQTSLRISWLLVSLLSIASAFALRRWLAGLGFPVWGALCGALLMLHPKLLSVSFSGTEAALSLLFIILALSEADRLGRTEKGDGRASLVFTGLILSRLDLSILLFVLAGYLNWNGISRKRIAKLMLLPALALGTWMTLNAISTGYLLPGSGVAKSIHAEMLWGEAGILGNFQSQAWLSGIKTVFLAESGLSFISLGMLLFALWLLWRKRPGLPIHGTLLAGAAGLLILTAAIYTLGAFRPWYLMPLFLSIGMMICIPLYYLARRKEAAVWLLIPLCGLLWIEAQRAPRTHHGPAYVEAATNAKQILRPGSRLGSFNSGIIGTVAGPELEVVNLDGVVNSDVIPALKERRLGEWVDEEGIEVILDHRLTQIFFSACDKGKLRGWYLDERDLVPAHPGTGFRFMLRYPPAQ